MAKKLYILHGWSYSIEKWKPFKKYMEEKEFEIIFLGVPGLTEETDKVWTLDEYVEWLRDKLEKENEVVLIGHSNGGRIAIAFAAKYPGLLKQLILIDSAGIYHNEIPLRFKRFVFKNIAIAGKKLSSSEKLRNVLYMLARESDYKNATPLMRKTLVNLITQDLTSELSKSVTPTLILWGEKDNLTPVSDAKIMHEKIRKSNLLVIEDAGHSPHFTHTNIVCRKILEEI